MRQIYSGRHLVCDYLMDLFCTRFIIHALLFFKYILKNILGALLIVLGLMIKISRTFGNIPKLNVYVIISKDFNCLKSLNLAKYQFVGAHKH